MLNIQQIESFFPENLRGFKRNILREYLQYKILEVLYSSPYGGRLSFMGGTAIHIVHGNPWFSEDLDFDNQGLTQEEFTLLAGKIRQALLREGYHVEITITARGAFRVKFRFSGLLQDMGITGHREEKLLIHLDAKPQKFDYQAERFLLSRFDVFCGIRTVPADILLSHKIACIFQRPRPMGRDFYDAIFLFGKTDPNMSFLSKKAGIESVRELWNRLKARCDELDFSKLAKDLGAFLTDPREMQKVVLFPEFVVSKNYSWAGQRADGAKDGGNALK